jgi:uncharacterized glyoxalase superfamily protein PhnB
MDNSKSTVIPCLRYRDAPAAIEWLCENFGFEKQLAVPHEDGTIAHAQLVFGGGLIMLGTAIDNEYGRVLSPPSALGGASTQGIYVIVPDADAVYAKAKAAGAGIVVEIKDEDYGGRGFTCRDLEDHVWSFGTYNPW